MRAAEESIFQTVMSWCRNGPQGLHSKEAVSCLFCGQRDGTKFDLEMCNDTERTVDALDRGKAGCYVQTNQPFKARIKSHLLFAGIISSPFSPR